MCKAFKDPASRHAAEKFAVAVQQLRKCNQDTMERLTEIMLARQDQTERLGKGASQRLRKAQAYNNSRAVTTSLLLTTFEWSVGSAPSYMSVHRNSDLCISW